MRFADFLSDKNGLFTGRASAAIYLALVANGIRDAKVLVPANICYAAVLPVLYSGNEPIFVDVGEDGNLTEATVAAAAADIKAAIIPHMYGNPCRATPAVSRMLRGKNVLVIEDCCLAMGADIDGIPVGSFGDYAVYSFGYSKTLDCGYGGLIVSQRKLDDLKNLNESLPLYTPNIDLELKLFSEVYRVLRNNPHGLIADAVYGFAIERMQHCFLYKGPDEQIARIRTNLDRLDSVIAERRGNLAIYEQALNSSPAIARYRFTEGSVPWRANILVDEARRPELIAALLQQHIEVSDWYPVIAPFFGVHTSFPQAARMEHRILNFPLLGVSKQRIQTIAQAINQYLATTPSTI